MEKKTKIIIALAAACAGTLVLGACAEESPYPDLAEQGYTVSVCFDLNGGKALENENVRIVDTYRLSDVQKGVKLVRPDDPRRTENPVNISRVGYFLAGWYQVRNYRTDDENYVLDEDGCRVLDEYQQPIPLEVDEDRGNIVIDFEAASVHGKSFGYTYADPWDFDTSVFGGADFDYEYKEGEVALTLYAAWVPFYSYQLYGETETGWEVFADYKFDPTQADAEENRTLAIPAWNTETGALDYGKLSIDVSREKTFLRAYTDSAMESQPVEVLENKGTWDPVTATSENGYSAYYAEWDDGLWYRIGKAEQLVANAALNHNFELTADIDFAAGTDGEAPAWPQAFSTGRFMGSIRGNGHAIKNVTVRQTDSSNTRGGLFGTIADGCVFDNVRFTGLTYRLEEASVEVGSLFGAFAGSVEDGAVMKDVTVQGTLHIGMDVYIPRGVYNPDTGQFGEPPHLYDVGLVTGNLYTEGIDASVTLEEGLGIVASADEHGKVTIGSKEQYVIPDGYRDSVFATEDKKYTITILKNGVVRISERLTDDASEIPTEVSVTVYSYPEGLLFWWHGGICRITFGDTITVEETEGGETYTFTRSVQEETEGEGA